MPVNSDRSPSWLADNNATIGSITECSSPKFARGPYVCHFVHLTALACATVAILCMWASTLSAINRPRFVSTVTNPTAVSSPGTTIFAAGTMRRVSCSQLWCPSILAEVLREKFYPHWQSWCFVIVVLLHTAINLAVMVAIMAASPEQPLVASVSYNISLVGLSVTGMLTALGFLVHGLKLHYHISASLNIKTMKRQAQRILRNLHIATAMITTTLVLRVFFQLYFYFGGSSGWLSQITYFVWFLLSQWIPYAVNVVSILFLLRPRTEDPEKKDIPRGFRGSSAISGASLSTGSDIPIEGSK